MSSLREKKPKEIKEDRGHPGEMRSDKLNALRCDSVNLTRQAVTSEFHPSTIVPTYGAGRAGKSEFGYSIERFIIVPTSNGATSKEYSVSCYDLQHRDT
jgi:hypothetical protein